jgi:hypothetical protein
MSTSTEETPIARIRMNERKATSLGYGNGLTLTRRRLETDAQGNFEVVGTPEADVFPRHLDVEIGGLPEGEETNPLRRAVMCGKVFVISGAVPHRNGTPVRCRMPMPDNAAEATYEQHTEFLERCKQADEPDEIVQRQTVNDAIKTEGRKILGGSIRDIRRNLSPKVENVRGKDNIQYLLTLVSYMHYRELDQEKPRKGVIEMLKEWITKLDPSQGFILNVVDDD